MAVTYTTVNGITTATFTGTGELTGATSQLTGATVAIIVGYSSIGASAFYNARSLTSITIPASVTSIGSNAFGNAIVLDTVTFEANSQLGSIGYGAFQGATSLTSINIPAGVINIGSQAFRDASSLTTVTFAEGSELTSIGSDAFRDASSLTSITIPASVTSITSYVFNGSGLTEATINVDGLGGNDFPSALGSGQSIGGKTGVTIIGYKVFTGTGPLTGATSLLNGASIAIIEGYSSIGDNAFQNATSLTSITIPDSVTSIGSDAFSGATGLTSITIPDSVTTIGTDAFLGSGLNTVYIANNHLSGISSPSTNVAFFGETVTTSNIYYSDDGTTATFLGISGDTLSGATTQLNGATIAIVEGYTSIGASAFQNASSLTSINIQASVTSIGSDAFSGASSLTSITVNESNLNYKDISGVLFDSNGETLIQYPIGNTRTEYEIPTSVTSIEANAFQDVTNLPSITIPEGVTSIGSDAFLDSSLNTVYIANNQLGITSPDTNVAFFGTTVTTSNVYYSDDGTTATFLGTGELSGATVDLSGASIAIIEGYSSIGASAFNNATGLTSITIPASVTSIGLLAFSGASSLTSITVNESNLNYKDIDGVLFNSNGETLIQYPVARTSYEIPTSVTSIGAHAFNGASSLTSITIPSSVTSIGDNAFQNASSLKTVTFEANSQINSIGSSAFKDAIALTSITIPDSVINIGGQAFNGTNLTEATINVDKLGASNFPSALGSGQSIGGKTGVTIIGYKVFTGTGPLTGATSLLNGASIAIIEGYSSIGSDAFKDATTLTSITIPDSVTSIGSSAFQDATSLTSINIPDSVTSIGSSAFSGASSLTSITIPAGVTSIGSSAFYQASGLTSITIPSSVTSIGTDAFNGSGLTEATINVDRLGDTNFPAALGSGQSIGGKTGVNIIGYKVFTGTGGLSGATSLLNGASIAIIEGYSSIGTSAFQDATSLTSITIPDSVTSIGSSAFSGASSLTSITIPAGVTGIGSSAFNGASGLTSITIPSSVTSIGTDAFNGSGLTEATINVDRLGDTNFPAAHGSGQSIGGKSGVTIIGYKAFTGTGTLTGATAQLNGASIAIIEGYSSIGAHAFNGASSLTSITIPDSVTSIGNHAFKQSGLTSIEIPASVESIGELVFYAASNLETVTFEANSQLDSIGARSFNNATGLTSITIPASVTSIEEDVFRNASSLETVTFETGSLLDRIEINLFRDSGLTSITMPDSVTSIGASAFQGSGLTSITIPASVVDIEGGAFKDASSLTTVTFAEGSELTSIGSSVFKNATSLTSITIPDSVINIGSLAFYGASSLTSINIPPLVTSLETQTFQNASSLTEATINVERLGDYLFPTALGSGQGISHSSSDLTIIGYKVFTGTGTLTGATAQLNGASIAIIEGYTIIGTDAFKDATSLTSITIPDSVTSIGDYAFSFASGLTSITIPSSVTSIGSSAFNGASGLTSITIPSSVTSIGTYAFYQASALTSVTFEAGSSLNSIDEGGFEFASALTSITIPASVTTIGIGAFNGSGLTEATINVDKLGGTYFPDALGSDQSIGGKTGVTIIGYKVFTGTGPLTGATAQLDGASIAIIEGYSSIGASAFNNASSLTSISIPASVTSIGSDAFKDATTLTSITIPDSVTSIEANAFQGTSSLTSITVNESNLNYKDISGVLFDSNGAILIQYPIGNTRTEYEILTSVISIEANAFQGTSSLEFIIIDNDHDIDGTIYSSSAVGVNYDSFFGSSSIIAYSVTAEEAGSSMLDNTDFNNVLTTIGIDKINMTNVLDRRSVIVNGRIFTGTITLPSGDFDSLTDENKTDLIAEVKRIYASIMGIPEDHINVTLESGSIIANVEGFESADAALAICFPAGTPVTTDQGIIPIEKLNTDKHTIDGQEIVAITQTRPLFKEIVLIKKNALATNVPSQNTEISNNHTVCYKGNMIKACELVTKCERVTFIPYNGETLYNVLLKKHSVMTVNNMVCETLEPNNIMAKICGGKYNICDQHRLCNELSSIIKANDIRGYIKLEHSIRQTKTN